MLPWVFGMEARERTLLAGRLKCHGKIWIQLSILAILHPILCFVSSNGQRFFLAWTFCNIRVSFLSCVLWLSVFSYLSRFQRWNYGNGIIHNSKFSLVVSGWRWFILHYWLDSIQRYWIKEKSATVLRLSRNLGGLLIRQWAIMVKYLICLVNCVFVTKDEVAPA